MDEDFRDALSCRGCGRELGHGVEFCPSCGTERGSKVVYVKGTGSGLSSNEAAFILLGGFLIVAGIMPFFMLDTSLIGVTGAIRLYTTAGIVGVAVGIVMILLGAVMPRARAYFVRDNNAL